MEENITQNKKSILIVEDDDICYSLLAEILAELELNAVRAISKDEALALLRKPQDFLLIVMDVFLHDSDNGYIIANELIRKKINLPIMIVSAYASALKKQYQKSLKNVKSVLDKPVQVETFKSELLKILEADCISQ